MTQTALIDFSFEDDILIAQYNSTKPITETVAKEMVRLRQAFTGNKAVKMVIVFPKLQIMDKSGRDHLSSANALEDINACAIVAQSVLGRVIVNFFLKLNRDNLSHIPHKAFNNKEDALEWIKEIS